jgi:cation/acetate symporter
MAILIFIALVVFLFGLSGYLGRKSNTADGFFVAGGQINWFINGVALTGGYLSAASFLGICGMIAFTGFDGYLYSIGFLSGWIVALFVVAEPLRRLGRYTFADALGANFKSRGIHLAAAISTLVISIFYLIPQMVGAGVLIEPLLGLPHQWGVILVGAVVIVIVASAGMSSTTYVQFIKATMLIVFSVILVGAVLIRGLDSQPETRGFDGTELPPNEFTSIPVLFGGSGEILWEETLSGTDYTFVDALPVDGTHIGNAAYSWILMHEPGASDAGSNESVESWWRMDKNSDGDITLLKAQSVEQQPDKTTLINGRPSSSDNPLLPMGRIARFGERAGYTGGNTPLGPMRFLAIFSDPQTVVEAPRIEKLVYKDRHIDVYYNAPIKGNEFMRPGGNFNLAPGAFWSRLDFISLMVALFFGTSALPHVLIRYYTVKDSQAARKSTIVAITAIGLFYVLTLYMGLGAVGNGVLNPMADNMSAPLLARSFGELLFAAITALAFATVLGTVSGLIVAASGAVANDLMDRYMNRSITGTGKVIAAKTTAVTVGVIAVVLGILFKGVNVGFLVGWAFAVAASANFPAIIMVLFWKRTTAAGVISSIFVGTGVALLTILLGPDMFVIYGLTKADALIPLSQPAIISMPLSMIAGATVSLLTSRKGGRKAKTGAVATTESA